jgi:hypothetical protein
MAHMRGGGQQGEAENAGREEDEDEDGDGDYGSTIGPSAAPQLPRGSQEDQNLLASSSQQHAVMLVNAMLATWRSSNEAGTAWAPTLHLPTPP